MSMHIPMGHMYTNISKSGVGVFLFCRSLHGYVFFKNRVNFPTQLHIKKGVISANDPYIKNCVSNIYANPATSSFMVTAILNRAVNTRKPMAHIAMAIRISGNVGTYSFTR